MDEDDCFAFAEFIEDSAESQISRVYSVRIGQDLKAHGAEMVKCVVNFG